MSLLSPDTLSALIAGYGVFAVAAIVALESIGVPLPGETMLIMATGYAAGHPEVSVFHIIVAAISGAILGDNAGYWLGRTYGLPVLARYGHHIGLEPRRLQLGQALFRRHGILVVFIGRFVAFLRILAAWLAGISHMRWTHFLAANAAGAIVWATAIGLAGYWLGGLLATLPVKLEISLMVAGLALLFGLHRLAIWGERRYFRRHDVRGDGGAQPRH